MQGNISKPVYRPEVELPEFCVPGTGKLWIVTLRSRWWIPINCLVCAETADLARYYAVELLLYERQRQLHELSICAGKADTAELEQVTQSRVGDLLTQLARGNLKWRVQAYNPRIISRIEWADNDYI